MKSEVALSLSIGINLSYYGLSSGLRLGLHILSGVGLRSRLNVGLSLHGLNNSLGWGLNVSNGLILNYYFWLRLNNCCGLSLEIGGCLWLNICQGCIFYVSLRSILNSLVVL